MTSKLLRKIALIIAIGSTYHCYAAPSLTLRYQQPILSQSIKPIDFKQLFQLGPANSPTAAALTMPATGAIHFLKVLFYSSTDCTTGLLDIASVYDNGTGLTFTNGQIVNLNSSSAYTLATNRGISTGSINCMQVYVDGGNASSKGIACQNFPESCPGGGTQCTTTDATHTGLSWSLNPTPCITSNLYITDPFNGGVQVCSTSSPTSSLSCSEFTNSHFNSARGVFVNNGFIYVGGNIRDSTQDVGACPIVPTTGAITTSSCIATGPAISSLNSGIVLNNKYAYVTIADNTTNEVYQCDANPTTGGGGALSNCSSTTGDGYFHTPNTITISNGYAYIGNLYSIGSHPIIQCSVDPTSGALSSCGPSGGVSAPTFGFLVYQITLNNGYAYIADNSNQIKKCDVSPADGSISNCGFTGPSGSSSPVALGDAEGISINNGYAYISDYAHGELVTCSVSPSDGTISSTSCVATTGLTTPGQSAIY